MNISSKEDCDKAKAEWKEIQRKPESEMTDADFSREEELRNAINAYEDHDDAFIPAEEDDDAHLQPQHQPPEEEEVYVGKVDLE